MPSGGQPSGSRQADAGGGGGRRREFKREEPADDTGAAFSHRGFRQPAIPARTEWFDRSHRPG